MRFGAQAVMQSFSLTFFFLSTVLVPMLRNFEGTYVWEKNRHCDLYQIFVDRIFNREKPATCC